MNNTQQNQPNPSPVQNNNEHISDIEDDDAFRYMHNEQSEVSMEIFNDVNKNTDKYEIVIIFECSQ